MSKVKPKRNALCELLCDYKTSSIGQGSQRAWLKKGKRVLVLCSYLGTYTCCYFDEDNRAEAYFVRVSNLKFIRIVSEEERGKCANRQIRRAACESKIRRLLKEGSVIASLENAQTKVFAKPSDLKVCHLEDYIYDSIVLANDFELLTCDDEEARKRAKDEEAYFVSKIRGRFESRKKRLKEYLCYIQESAKGFKSTHGLLPGEFTARSKDLTKQLKEDFTALIEKRNWISEVQRFQDAYDELEAAFDKLLDEFIDHFLEKLREKK